jgi:hypothetical protein
MKNYWLLLLLFLTSGCYTQVKHVSYSPNKVTHVVALDSKGDTVNIDINQFYILYNNQPNYYYNWRFYHNHRWISPYSYYRYYYPRYSPVVINTIPYYHTSPRVEQKSKESTPRSSGTSTQQRTRNNESSRTSSTRRTRNQ